MNIDIAKRLKHLRKRLGLSQEEFAERLGKSIRTIQNWESGQTAPNDKTLRLIAHTFGVSYKWLKEGKGEMWEREEEFPQTERELIAWIVDKVLDTAEEMGIVLSVSEVLDITKFLYERFHKELRSKKLSEEESKGKIKEVLHTLKGG